ncbi:MAG TPA: hypothetical protein VMS88_05240 [Terriglobales bacterium]|nr:hypothetical protein [Terriglobales bacterium]
MSARGRRSHRADAAAPAVARGFPRGVFLGACALALAIAVFAAAHRAWTCDDAFISFRYAENLVRGHGLVFNAGERVEGYTNFLWTMLVALGLRLGADAEAWAIVWGIAAYAGAVALLAFHARRRAGEAAAFALPIAALLAAVHPDWQRFATSGLETSLFTALLVLGYVLLLARTRTTTASASAGVALALATMTRPEGLIFAALAAAFIGWFRRSGRALAAFALAFLALWIPFTIWRVAYYGDFFPNTFYAKSGGQAWWDQGVFYAQLYFQKYWLLAAALPALWAAVALQQMALPRRRRFRDRAEMAEPALATAFAAGLLLYVTRVGGDFMFARMLIPVTPFLLVLAELVLTPVLAWRWNVGLAATALALAALEWSPEPIWGTEQVAGITNEWAWYPDSLTAAERRMGTTLGRYLAGTPAIVAFWGGGARITYYARPAVAIESEAGLTDRLIARQKLETRGRVGHEKHATLDYLVRQRRADLALHTDAPLSDSLPNVYADFGGTKCRLLHWNPALVAEWRRRGARVEDFPRLLDTAIASMPRHAEAQVAAAYVRARRFYFDFVSDSARERPFLARLGAHPAP